MDEDSNYESNENEKLSYSLTKDEAVSNFTKEGRIWYEYSPDLDYEVFIDKGDHIECVWHDRYSDDAEEMYSLIINPVDMSLEYNDRAGLENQSMNG